MTAAVTQHPIGQQVADNAGPMAQDHRFRRTFQVAGVDPRMQLQKLPRIRQPERLAVRGKVTLTGKDDFWQ